MTEFANLENAIASLGETITDFSTGVLRTLEESKSIDERCKIMKERLKHLNTKLLRFKAHREFRMLQNLSSIKETLFISDKITDIVASRTDSAWTKRRCTKYSKRITRSDSTYYHQ